MKLERNKARNAGLQITLLAFWDKTDNKKTKLESSANSATIDTILKVFKALKAEIKLNVKLEDNFLKLASNEARMLNKRLKLFRVHCNTQKVCAFNENLATRSEMF